MMENGLQRERNIIYHTKHLSKFKRKEEEKQMRNCFLLFMWRSSVLFVFSTNSQATVCNNRVFTTIRMLEWERFKNYNGQIKRITQITQIWTQIVFLLLLKRFNWMQRKTSNEFQVIIRCLTVLFSILSNTSNTINVLYSTRTLTLQIDIIIFDPTILCMISLKIYVRHIKKLFS